LIQRPSEQCLDDGLAAYVESGRPLIEIRNEGGRFYQAPTSAGWAFYGYYFQMIHSGNGEDLGGINLRYVSTVHVERYAGHIGFSVHPQHRGNRFAARSVVLLLPFAKQLGFVGLWITCDPENVASRRSLERTGAKFIEVVDVPADCIIRKTGHPLKCRYWIDLSDIRI
jgi:predicted acetyltransferase